MKNFWLAGNNILHYIDATFQASIKQVYTFLFSSVYTPKKILIVISFLTIFNSYAQTGSEKQAEYKKAVTERVTKIVNTLGLNDSDKYRKVLCIIVNQYFRLNDIHEESKNTAAAIKTQSLTKELADAALKIQEEKKSSQLLQQHTAFITLLKNNLTPEQTDRIKDGMTYRVFPITYAAYLDMLPNLTSEQKEKIYNWLKEARELAMDAESADKKHAVFGKYKGRINNYLSAAGYDMKKEGEEWQKRIKQRSALQKEQKDL